MASVERYKIKTSTDVLFEVWLICRLNGWIPNSIIAVL